MPFHSLDYCGSAAIVSLCQAIHVLVAMSERFDDFNDLSRIAQSDFGWLFESNVLEKVGGFVIKAV